MCKQAESMCKQVESMCKQAESMCKQAESMCKQTESIVEIDEYDEVVNLWINKYPNIHIDVTTIKQQI